MDNLFTSLDNKYKLLKTMNLANRRFYHLKSIRNFLRHFNEINNYHEKTYVYNLLNEFLDIVIKDGISNYAECRDLSIKYISPVGRLYARKLRFAIYFKWYTISFCIISMYLLMSFFSAHWIIQLLGYGIIIFFIIEMLIKINQKRIFGICY
jgi:hypothetical protein